MTVIAAFRPQGCPTLFGDLLLSGPERLDVTVSIPTIGDVRNFYPEGSGWSIIGLQQKLVLISDNCAIGWAGSQLGARIAISQLRELASQEPLTSSSLRNFMDNMNEDTTKLGTSFVGFLITSDSVLYFKHEAESFQDLNVGAVFIEGTGKDAFKEVLLGSNFKNAQIIGDANSIDIAASIGLMIAGTLLRNEYASGSNLRSYFGGGYEVAVHTVNGFKKLGNVTFVFWDSEIKEGSVNLTPLFIAKQKYLDDVLLLRSATLGAATGEFLLVDEQLHAVLPIYKYRLDSGLPERSDVPYQSPLVCHCFLVRNGEQTAVHARVQRCAANSESGMVFNESGGELLSIGFNPAFITRVCESIASGFNLSQ